MASVALTPRQLASLQVLAQCHPSPVALADATGFGYVGLNATQRLVTLGLVRFEQRLYPSAWVAFLTTAGHQYAQGVI